jgi:hypothetical protein
MRGFALAYEALFLSRMNPGLVGAATYRMLQDSTQRTFLEVLAAHRVAYRLLLSWRCWKGRTRPADDSKPSFRDQRGLVFWRERLQDPARLKLLEPYEVAFRVACHVYCQYAFVLHDPRSPPHSDPWIPGRIVVHLDTIQVSGSSPTLRLDGSDV